MEKQTEQTNFIDSLFDVPQESEKQKSNIIIPVDKFTSGASNLPALSIKKDIRKDKYKSEPSWKPASAAERDKCFKIYEEYISSTGTQMQLAKKHGLTNFHISRIVKFVTFELGDTDNKAYLQSLISGLEHRKVSIQESADFTMEVDDKSKCWKAMLQIDRTIAQMKGLMSAAVIDMSTHTQTANFQLNEGFAKDRRSGSDMEGGEVGDVVDAEAEIIDDDMDGAVEAEETTRRTGSDMGEEE